MNSYTVQIVILSAAKDLMPHKLVTRGLVIPTLSGAEGEGSHAYQLPHNIPRSATHQDDHPCAPGTKVVYAQLAETDK
jgi:hypothetical protein